MSLPALSESRTPVVPNMTKRASRRGWAPSIRTTAILQGQGKPSPYGTPKKFAEKTRTRGRRNGVAQSYFSPRKITLRYATRWEESGETGRPRFPLPVPSRT